jgi:hypothetical protein
MTVFVLQNNSFDRIGRLITPCLEFCRQHGFEFVDRSLTSDLDVDAMDLDETNGLVVYGSIGWAKRFKKSRFSRWIDYDEDGFAASTWGPILGRRAFSGGGELLSVRDAFERLVSGASFHMRPDRDDKAFAGGVFDVGSWSETLAERGERLGPHVMDLACWVSPIRQIDAEIRCWFVGSELIDASFYRQNGTLEATRVEDKAVMRMASELGELYLPVGNAVMDIAQHGGEAYVLEYNPIHSSGWYAANVERVLGAWVEELRSRRIDRMVGRVVPVSA